MQYSFVAVAYLHHLMAVFPVTPDISFCQNTGPNSSLNLNIYVDNAFLGSIYDKNTIKDQVKKIKNPLQINEQIMY